ncbi:ras-related protein Rap-2a [Galendromus occidentalis]|uniref:Ras-related protein Rap-2a n=1 Tax=Galendromus occidentalis TaxID=34638 RepID=A0AAJ6VZM1_9ACAR|nr:ras-related protein Rap-2a [Galendromus occidentalis]
MPQKIDSPLRSVTDEVPLVSARDKFTLVVLGASKVGKTTIVQQFLYGNPPEKYVPTVEEFHQGELEFDGTSVTLDIIDTSGAMEFPAQLKVNIQKADAFLLVFSYNNQESFEQAARLRDLILKLNNKDPKIVVVGNKGDLLHDAPERCAISRELAESLAVIDWEVGFVDCCAKENRNVLEIFNRLLALCGLPYELPEKPKKSKLRKTSLPSFVANPSDPKVSGRRHNSCNVS